MKNMMKSMMLSCDKATILVEKRIDVGLAFSERLKLRFHTSMCDACTNYQKQSLLIHELLRKHVPADGNNNSIPLVVSNQLKAEILRKLKNN
jgi:hypothetical protein